MGVQILSALVAFSMFAACSRMGADANEVDAGGSGPAPVAEVLEVVPWVTTPQSELQPPGYIHTEVLRIARDFGNEDFEIVIDAWVPKADRGAIADVRLWWFKTRSSDRGPFSKKTQRHFDIAYERRGPAQWEVAIVSDRKHFAFTIELDGSGTPVARADVVVGARREHGCRVSSGRLEARRFLGAPVGLKKLKVTCVDGEGRSLSGHLVDHR